MVPDDIEDILTIPAPIRNTAQDVFSFIGDPRQGRDGSKEKENFLTLLEW